jgi:general stress protein 26
MEGEMKLEEVVALIEDSSVVILATVNGDRPAARPMTLKKVDGRLYFLTEAGSPKAVQLRKNPRCLVYRGLSDGENNGFINLDCMAEETTDPALRKRLYDSAKYASSYWSSPEDPRYVLLRITPESGRVLKPGEESASGIE